MVTVTGRGDNPIYEALEVHPQYLKQAVSGIPIPYGLFQGKGLTCQNKSISLISFATMLRSFESLFYTCSSKLCRSPKHGYFVIRCTRFPSIFHFKPLWPRVTSHKLIPLRRLVFFSWLGRGCCGRVRLRGTFL